jgi:hypothetical protein
MRLHVRPYCLQIFLILNRHIIISTGRCAHRHLSDNNKEMGRDISISITLKGYSNQTSGSVWSMAINYINIVAYLPHARKAEPQNQPLLSTHVPTVEQRGYANRF